MSHLLANVNDQNTASIATEIKQIKFGESQFYSFLESFFNFAVSENESSSSGAYAQLAKELENFVVSFSTSTRVLFSDELIGWLHLAMDNITTYTDKVFAVSKRMVATTSFIGNLYNVGFLTPRLLRHWMSNLSSLKNKTLAEILARSVKQKVQQDLKTVKKNATLISIMELISELKIVDTAENG